MLGKSFSVDKGLTLHLVRLDLLVAVRSGLCLHLLLLHSVLGLVQDDTIGIHETKLVSRLLEKLLTLLHLELVGMLGKFALLQSI